jgi:flagellar hook-associated protein 1 FlgK
MASLVAALGSAGNALNVIQQALDVVQNNVGNSSTPGFATQQFNFEAQPFDTASGLAGGVGSGGTTSTRDQYADSNVQQQLQALGFYTAQSQSTGTIQSFFNVSGTSGVAAALNNLFTSFSAWSATPSDATAQQTVISDASALAQQINGLSNSMTQTGQQLDRQIGSTVGQINTLASQVQQYNAQILQESQPDSGAAANLENTLESLSQLTNITTLHQADGTVTLLIGGTPLVIGDQQYSISEQTAVKTSPPPVNADSPPTDQILDSQGNDVTSEVTGGQLGGLLDSKNRVLASIIGDGQQAGTLNQFAQSFADTVNGILESGTVSTAPGAAAGIALFNYNNADATLAAGTLTVNPAMAPGLLAPVDANGNSNGNANQLAALATAEGQIDGQSYSGYFGGIATSVGQENQTAANNETTQQSVLSQAQSLQQNISGVSLNAQATDLLQYQKAYQAVTELMTTISNLTNSLLAIMPPAGSTG